MNGKEKKRKKKTGNRAKPRDRLHSYEYKRRIVVRRTIILQKKKNEKKKRVCITGINKTAGARKRGLEEGLSQSTLLGTSAAQKNTKRK